MKRILVFLFLVIAIVAWCTPVFAADPAREAFAGAGTHTMTATGVTNGVTLTGQGGGSILDITAGYSIFTYNNPLGTAIATAAVTTDVSSQTHIQFLGASTVYGDIGSAGGIFLDIQGGAADTEVDFLGNVYATKVIFTTDSIISLAKDKTVNNGAVTTTAGANTGTVILGGGSNWGGTTTAAITGVKTINVVGKGVSATITGAVGTNQFSLGSNTLNIGGALTFTTNGVINTNLDSATVYGNLVVTGASNLGTGLTVKVSVPTPVDIPVGTLFKIVTGAGTGSLATVDPTNSLYTFSIEPVAAGGATIKVLTIPVVAVVTPPPGVDLPAEAPVAAAVAPALAAAPATNDVSGIRATINTFTDVNDVVDAEAQLAPLAPSLAVPLITFHGAREFQDLWLDRLDMCSQLPLRQSDQDDPSCRGNNPRSNWWGKGFGHSGFRKDTGAYKGFETKTYGTMIAYDAPIGTDTRAGLGVGYSWNKIEGKFYDTGTHFDTYRATAYIGHEMGPWFVNGSASFGWNEYDGYRHIVFTGTNRTANRTYSGQDYTAFTSTGYNFSVQEFTLTPFASLQYTRVNIGSFHEDGAGDINLQVNRQRYNFYESGLGVKVARDFSYRGRTFVPEVHYKWLRDFSNPTLKQTAVFNIPSSTPFTTHGLKVSSNTHSVGTSITLLDCACRETTWSVNAGYDYDWRADNFSANQGTLRITKRF